MMVAERVSPKKLKTCRAWERYKNNTVPIEPDEEYFVYETCIYVLRNLGVARGALGTFAELTFFRRSETLVSHCRLRNVAEQFVA